MNGVVNARFAAPNTSLGGESIGFLLAFTSLVAAISATVFGKIHMHVGKGAILLLGSVAFLTIPAALLYDPPRRENNYWGSWLVALYFLQGLGRAVYEGTNKAVFADFFLEQQSVGAFANQIMQNSVAFSLSFFLQAVLPAHGAASAGRVLPMIILVLAGLTFPGYLISFSLQRCARAHH